MLSLDGPKATLVGGIPTDMPKSTVGIYLPFITKIIKCSFENGRSSDELKLAEVSPTLKKNDDLDKENYRPVDKENYRPVSILSPVSKVSERIMYIQIATFMRDKLSKLLTGFRKNHSTQHCLMSMLEMWKNTLGKEGCISAIYQRPLTH